MYGGHVALAELHGLGIDERPGGVGIVVSGELASFSVFLHDERSLETWLLGIVGNLHPLTYIGPDVIGAEVEVGQVVERPS